MTPKQIAREQAQAKKIGIEPKTPENRDQLESLIAGLLAHHAPVDFAHRSKARSLIDGLQIHGLLQQFS